MVRFALALVLHYKERVLYSFLGAVGVLEDLPSGAVFVIVLWAGGAQVCCVCEWVPIRDLLLMPWVQTSAATSRFIESCAGHAMP